MFYSTGCLFALYFVYIRKIVKIFLDYINVHGIALFTLLLIIIQIFYTNEILLFLYISFGLLTLILFSKKCENKIIIKCSEYSFFIYSFHEFYEAFLKHAIMMIVPINNFSLIMIYMLLPLFIIAFCIVLGILTKKKVPLLYKLLCGGR